MSLTRDAYLEIRRKGLLFPGLICLFWLTDKGSESADCSALRLANKMCTWMISTDRCGLHGSAVWQFAAPVSQIDKSLVASVKWPTLDGQRLH